ncbi:MAG: hypothetical protein KF763_08775 [Cyclobacteriaceae bacterium]|nr:hypothetical protein [Cyclobacteriaceae bacterium]
MDKKHEKAMLDLQRLMEAANLKTEADYDRFIKEFTGKTIPKQHFRHKSKHKI